MVLDNIKNASRYYSLHPLFKEAFEYLESNSVEMGETILIEDKLKIIRVDADMRPHEEAKLEAHDKFIDIQILLEGKESFGWSFREDCNRAIGEYNTQNDIIFYEDSAALYYTMSKGEFSIFFPEDCHAPLIGEGLVSKIIVKVLL